MAQRMSGFGPSSWLLLACSLPLFALIVGLAGDHFDRQRSALLPELETLAGEQQHALETMLAEASRELSRMRLTMEDRLPIPLQVRSARFPGICARVWQLSTAGWSKGWNGPRRRRGRRAAISSRLRISWTIRILRQPR